MKSIHQFVAGFSHGDAISNETLMLRDIFRSWGYQSEIFSETKRILPELRKEAHDAAAYAASCRPEDIVLLHLSIGSPVNRIFAELPCKKAILYHNITPPEFLQGIQAQIASHRLMLRAGLIRQTSAGIYAWLPAGLRVLRNVEQIVREEQDLTDHRHSEFDRFFRWCWIWTS